MIQRTRLARGLGVVLLAALVVTVVVAIWAWHWSTDFTVQLTAGFTDLEGRAGSRYQPPNDPRRQHHRLIDQPELIIRIANRSPFSARNPACRVTMRGLAGMTVPRIEEGWSHVGVGGTLEDVAQWDGGANYFIHGKWFRDLHLSVNQAAVLRADLALVVEVVAEGFQKTWTFPMTILAPADFERRFPEFALLIPDNLRGWEGPAWLKKP